MLSCVYIQVAYIHASVHAVKMRTSRRRCLHGVCRPGAVASRPMWADTRENSLADANFDTIMRCVCGSARIKCVKVAQAATDRLTELLMARSLERRKHVHKLVDEVSSVLQHK
jgi:hypothetical protein